jgi:hypothetical protein
MCSRRLTGTVSAGTSLVRLGAADAPGLCVAVWRAERAFNATG